MKSDSNRDLTKVFALIRERTAKVHFQRRSLPVVYRACQCDDFRVPASGLLWCATPSATCPRRSCNLPVRPASGYIVLAVATLRSDAVALRNEQFVARYEEAHLRAWRLALYLCGRREDAEDLLAEAVAHAIKNFAKLRDPEKFGAWFLRLMRNLHIDHLRKRQRQLDVADFGGDVIIWERLGRYPTVSGPHRNAEIRAVFRAVDRLPEGIRTPLVLSALEGMTTDEIAGVMGIGRGAVKVRIHRARKKLQEFLGPEFEVTL